MSTININGVELELDLLDADVLERYEMLHQEVAAKSKAPLPEGTSTADGMRMQCRIVDEFFDALFGPGTAKRVLGENSNLGLRLEAFGKVASMSSEVRQEISAIADRYGPGRLQNRDQRRQQKKGKPPYVNNGYPGRLRQ